MTNLPEAPFATRAPWRFTAVQGPATEDPILGGGETAPGVITLCLSAGPGAPCDPALSGVQRAEDDLYAGVRYLERAEVVHPLGPDGPAVLLVRTASLHGGNGDQLVRTQALAYRRAEDRFARVYERQTGRNNNQETRFIETGPLRGDIVSVQPTRDAPFAFWVSVSAFDPDGPYREVLRYRSATRYGDGNPLAVIDSETPEIERRLGLWKPGRALPLPASRCARPHLVKGALWCG